MPPSPNPPPVAFSNAFFASPGNVVSMTLAVIVIGISVSLVSSGMGAGTPAIPGEAGDACLGTGEDIGEAF